jgi:hypothetical protein
LAGADTDADLERLVNGLIAVKEFKERDDEVKVIFDGGGTEWLHKLIDSGHPAHRCALSRGPHSDRCDR